MAGFVQYGANANTTGDAISMVISLATLSGAGNTLFLMTSGGVKTVKDNTNNIWYSAASINFEGLNWWYAYNINSGVYSITVSLPAGSCTAIAQEFTGTGTSNPLDLTFYQTAYQTSSSNPYFTATLSTSQANEIIIPFIMPQTGFADPLSGISSPYTNYINELTSAGNVSLGSGSNVVSVITTAVATFSFSTSREFVGSIFSLKLSSGSSSVPPVNRLLTLGVGI